MIITPVMEGEIEARDMMRLGQGHIGVNSQSKDLGPRSVAQGIHTGHHSSKCLNPT